MRKRTPRMHASPLRYTRRHARRSGSFRRMRRMYPAAEPFGRVSRLQPKSARGDRLISRSSTRRQARGCRLQRSDTFPRSRHRRHADRFDGRHAADCACGQPTGRPQHRYVDHATTAFVSAASAGAIARHREGWPAPGVVSLPKRPDNEPDSVGKPPGERIRYRRAVRRMRDRLDPAPPATRGRRAGEPPLLLTFHFGNETAAPMFQRCVRDALTPCAADMSGRWHGYRRAGSHGGLACRSTLPAGHAPVRRRSAIGRATHFSGPRNTRKRPHGDADFALWEADDGQDETTASRGEEMLSRDLAGRRRIRVLLRLVCRRAGSRVCRAEHDDATARRSAVIRAVASRAGRDIGRHGRRIGQCIGRCGRRDAARGSRAALLRPGRVRRRTAPRRRHGGEWRGRRRGRNRKRRRQRGQRPRKQRRRKRREWCRRRCGDRRRWDNRLDRGRHGGHRARQLGRQRIGRRNVGGWCVRPWHFGARCCGRRRFQWRGFGWRYFRRRCFEWRCFRWRCFRWRYFGRRCFRRRCFRRRCFRRRRFRWRCFRWRCFRQRCFRQRCFRRRCFRRRCFRWRYFGRRCFRRRRFGRRCFRRRCFRWRCFRWRYFGRRYFRRRYFRWRSFRWRSFGRRYFRWRDFGWRYFRWRDFGWRYFRRRYFRRRYFEWCGPWWTWRWNRWRRRQ